MNWVIAVVVLVIIGVVLDREIYFYEGVHFGPRLQARLYDRWSRKYDEGKRASQLHDDEMLAQPLLDALAEVPEPFVLDFAAGTGRLSYILISQPKSRGYIIALDLSQGMLEQVASKLSRQLNRVELLRHQTLPLPFRDAAFDVVCALEVLELFPNMDDPLSEFNRVLHPGGILLTSRGTEESGRKAKVKSVIGLTSLLERNGFEKIQITKWWKLFDRVIAVKQGLSNPTGAKIPNRWKCERCGNELLITKEGIILN